MNQHPKGRARGGDRFAPRHKSGPPGFKPRPAGPRPGRDARPAFRPAPDRAGFPDGSSTRGEAGDEKISRLNPLLEVLKATPSRVSKIFVQRDQGSHRLGEVLKEARNGDVPFVFVPREKLDRMAMHHQGVVAFLAPKAYSSLEDLLSGPGVPFLVLLDEVEDPQNVGAIVRSAEAAGASGLVLPERRSAGLTEAVATVSAGALAHLKVARVANLAQAMEDLKRAGVWLVGAEGGTPDSFESFRLHRARGHRARLGGPRAPDPGPEAVRQGPLHPHGGASQLPQRGLRRRRLPLRSRPPAAGEGRPCP